MVDTNSKNDEPEGLQFDDLIEEVDFNGIRDRQQSCYAKDLAKEDTPDFLKQANAKEVPKGGTLTQVMYVGIEDEDLTKYKERLIGELPASVKRATQLGQATPRKLDSFLISDSSLGRSEES